METNEDLVALLNDVMESTANMAHKYGMSKEDVSILSDKFDALIAQLGDIFDYNNALDEFLRDALPDGTYDFLTFWFYAMMHNQAIMSQIGCLSMDGAARMVTVMNPDELQ
jgi:hypothetical protein